VILPALTLVLSDMAQISKRKNNFEMKLPIMRRGLGFFLIFSLSIFSCSEDEPVMPDMGFDYYPLQVGNYSIYQVQESKINGSLKTNLSYELRVLVTDSAVSEQGVVTYFLVREKRTNSSGKWESLDTWSTKVINNSVIQNEGNVLFVKLIFPPSLNLKWNGNQYNNVKVDENPFNVSLPYDGNILTDSNSDQYFISAQNVPVTLSTGFEADNTLTVVHNNYQDDVVGKDQRNEIYARGVGLIYKEVNQYIECNGSICSGDKAGTLIQSLKEYGQM
jgi:hypothetical protein